MKLFFLFFSIVLYFISPDSYNYLICLISVIIFIVLLITTLKSYYKNNNYISFFLFFSISFFFVNFFYPVFIYPYDMNYFVVFERFGFNEKVMTKSTVLALIAYCSLIYGLDKSKLNINQIKERAKASNFKLNKYVLNGLFVLALIFNVILLFLASDGIVNRSSDAFFKIEPFLLVVCQVLINLILILVFYLKKSFVLLTLPILYILIFLYVGDRGPAIQGGLVLLFSYHYFYKKIKASKFSVLLIGAFIGLFIISSIRARSEYGSVGRVNEVKVTKYYDIAMDFIVNNRNLYAGYEYANINGYSYGESFVPYIFAPIPLLPTYVSRLLYNAEPTDLSSGTILTNEANSSWGLGTNLVADLYMQFGVLGVIFFMLMLGYLIKYLERNLSKSFYIIIIYFFIVSFAVYMPRSTLFDSFRYIVWASFFYFMIYRFFNTHKSIS